MFSKVACPVAEYLCRWKIPGWDQLKSCFVDSVHSDRFLCTYVSEGIKKSFTVWFPDGSALKHKDQRTLRWTKLLNKAMRTGSKVVLIGDMVTCEGETSEGNLQFRLTNQNALMMSGQCSMSGDQARIFEYCCGGFKGWTRTMLQTKLDSTSKQMMSDFKDMMSTFSVDAQPTVQPGRTKDRERAGRSRSPKED